MMQSENFSPISRMKGCIITRQRQSMATWDSTVLCISHVASCTTRRARVDTCRVPYLTLPKQWDPYPAKARPSGHGGVKVRAIWGFSRTCSCSLTIIHALSVYASHHRPCVIATCPDVLQTILCILVLWVIGTVSTLSTFSRGATTFPNPQSHRPTWGSRFKTCLSPLLRTATRGSLTMSSAASEGAAGHQAAASEGATGHQPTAPAAPAPSTELPQAAAVQDVDDVPDPDEDDLDDLDEMLDDFSTVKIDEKKPETPLGPSQPDTAASAAEEPALSEEDFAKQLQAGMADLLGELENSPEMQAQFESIFKELGASSSMKADQATTAEPTTAGSGESFTTRGGDAGADASFQETIRRTMERMQTSGDQATAAAAAGGSDDFLAELMKQMQGGRLEGEGSEEEFSKMLLGMMEQITTKEILYEPMKELHDKFPEWMEKNRAATSAEDLKRYEEQQVFVKEIVAKFEEPSYSDSNQQDREYVLERMQKMQASGSPPPDLVGDMPSAQDALNMPDESCNPQ